MLFYAALKELLPRVVWHPLLDYAIIRGEILGCSDTAEARMTLIRREIG
jgi:hypothetical protein